MIPDQDGAQGPGGSVPALDEGGVEAAAEAAWMWCRSMADREADWDEQSDATKDAWRKGQVPTIIAYLRAVPESAELVRLRSIRHGVQGGLSDAEDPLTALLPSGELPLTDPVGQDAPVLVGELDGSDSDSHVFTMTRSGPKRRTPPRFYQHRFDAHLVCELCGVTRAECDDAEFYPICIPIPLVEAPSIQDMIADLDKALHGRTWARPQTPKQVWEELLDEVAHLRAVPESDDGFRPWDSIEAGDLKTEYERAVNTLAAYKMRALMLSLNLSPDEAAGGG